MGKGKIEKAVQLAGNQHIYQKKLIAVLALLWIFMNFIMIGPAYIYMDPAFNCLSKRDRTLSQQQACPIIDQCHIIDKFTLTAQLKLYCHRQDERTGIQSIFSIGSFAGLIIMNIISDTKGRKIAMLISLGCMIVGTVLSIVGGVYDLVGLLMISQILNGFGGYATVSLSYILLADFCSDKTRQMGTIIINTAWGVSTILLGGFYLFQVNWLDFLIWILLAPLVIVLTLFYYILLESPYVLMGLNQKQKALKSLQKMCKFNKREFNLKQIQEIISNQQQKTQVNQTSLKNLIKIIKKKQNVKPILLLTIIYGIGNTLYYGIMYAIDTQGSGFGVNCMSSGGIEIVSYLYLGFFITKIPRRKGVAFFYGLATIVGIILVFPVIKGNNLSVTIIICANRLFNTIGYTLIACMQIQCFTVQIQSTACGMIEAMSLFGVFIAPIIVDLACNIGIDPIVFLSLISTFAIWPNIFLKETLPSNKKQNPLLLEFLQESNSEVLIFSKPSIGKLQNQQIWRESILTQDDCKDDIIANPQESQSKQKQ